MGDIREYESVIGLDRRMYSTSLYLHDLNPLQVDVVVVSSKLT